MQINTFKINKLYPWAIFIIGMIIFSLAVPSEYQSFYIARFGLFVKTMAEHGISVFNFQFGQPYPDYLAAPTLMSYLSSLLFGKISVFTTALPNIIVAALTLVFVYMIGAIHSRKWGIYATILTFFTVDFFNNASTLSPDAYITLITCVSFYIAYTAHLYGYKNRLLLLPLILILGFAFRGPIGLIVPSAVLCGFYLFSKNFKALLYFSLIAAILFIACITLLLNAAYHTGGKNFLEQIINMQASGRFEIDKAYLYLRHISTIFSRYLPVSLLSIITIFLLCKTKYFKQQPEQTERNLLIYLIVWAVIILLGISMVTMTKSRYYLAMTPALALIAAYLFVIDRKYIRIASICYLLPWIGLISIIGLWIYNFYSNLFTWFNFPLVIVLLALVAIISLIIRKTVTAIGAGILTYIIISIYNPLNGQPYVTTNFMTKVQTYQLPITFYKLGHDNFNIQLIADAPAYFTPQFIDSQQQLINSKQKIIIITYYKNFPAIKSTMQNKIQVIADANIKGRNVVAFILNSEYHTHIFLEGDLSYA